MTRFMSSARVPSFAMMLPVGKGEYTITNGAGAYLPRLTMNSRDVVVNIKKAHLTLSKYRSGKDSNGELGGASLNITGLRDASPFVPSVSTALA